MLYLILVCFYGDGADGMNLWHCLRGFLRPVNFSKRHTLPKHTLRKVPLASNTSGHTVTSNLPSCSSGEAGTLDTVQQYPIGREKSQGARKQPKGHQHRGTGITNGVQGCASKLCGVPWNSITREGMPHIEPETQETLASAEGRVWGLQVGSRHCGPTVGRSHSQNT